MSNASQSPSESSANRQLPAALLSVAAYPGCGDQDVSLIETHISWVFLLKRRVFKVRKPVNLGFVDFRELERRRVDCLDEVRLNASLAPDVYQGVVPISWSEQGGVRVGWVDEASVEGTSAAESRLEPSSVGGVIVDWAVQMRRLSETERADVLLAAGKLDGRALDAIAARIAAFHAERMKQPARSGLGSVEEVVRNVEDNFSETSETLGRYLAPDEAAELVEAQRRFLRQRRRSIEARFASGKVCETHGDLRLEHIYLDAAGEIRILDCVEFSERFRVADVAADIAFLAMDLTRLGHPEASEALLVAYVNYSRDYELYPLIDFYQSYRAFVRGKIAALIADDAGSPLETRGRAANEARRCFRLALAVERPSVVQPTLFAVGGAIASGKSTVAAELGRALAAPVIATDPTRKELLGVSPTTQVNDPAWSGSYDAAVTERVYAEVLRRAELVLGAGRSVIIDASFRTRALRAKARDLAHASSAAFQFVECTAPPAVSHARLAERAKAPSVSDGRQEIAAEFRRCFDAVDELPAAEHIVLDTSSAGFPRVQQILERVPHWPV